MAVNSLVFYTNPMSRGRIARWMLEEVGEPYETRVLEYGQDMKSADYLAINPMGKVPCIQHGETIVTEAAAICVYLAEAFAGANLKPSLDKLGAYYRWLFFAAGPIETLATITSLGLKHSPEHERMLGYGNYETFESTLSGWLAEHEFIVGDQFTAADVYVASHIGWGMQMNTIKNNEIFEDYSRRMFSREAHKRAEELDDRLVASQQ